MQISVAAWLTLDALLDNAIAVEIQSGGDDAMVARAQRLRERGWAVSAEHPQRGRGPAGWPPPSASFDINATAAELAFLRAEVAAALEVTQHILADDRLHPEVRAEQEASSTVLERARADLAKVAAGP